MSQIRHLTEIDAEIKIGAVTFPVTLDVHGYRRSGYPGGREQPAELAGHVIDRVMLETHDITNALPLDAVKKIAEEIDRDAGLIP